MNHPSPGFLLAFVGFGALLLCEPLARNTAAGEVAEAVQEKLASDDFPWYDPATGSLRRVEVPSAEPLPQGSNWEWTSKPARNRGTWPSFWSGVQYVIWGVLALLFAVLLFLLLRSMARRNAEQLREVSGHDPLDGHEADRIEQLPFQIAAPQTDLLAEAQRLYQAGKFAEAIVYLFSYQLIQLDRRQLIRLTKGKTNRQYLREIRQQPGLRTLVAATMLVFEDVFFGHYPLDRARFESCWNQLDAFHQYLDRAAPAS